MSSGAKDDDAYQSPKANERCLPTPPTTPSLTWWEGRRLRYNIGLLVAGVLAFACYVVICFTLLPQVLDPGEIEITPFTALFQGIGYLVLIGVANVLYFLGPLSEAVFQPVDVERYRRVCYRLGFWFSVLLPFGIPALLFVLILFFPNYWKGEKRGHYSFLDFQRG